VSNKRDDPDFKAICDAAHERVSAVLNCLAVLVPDATPRQRNSPINSCVCWRALYVAIDTLGCHQHQFNLPLKWTISA